MKPDERRQLARLEARFRKLPEAAKVEMMKALEAGGRDLVDGARALAPVDSGALRNSIEMTPGGRATPPYSQPGGSSVVPEGTVQVTAGNTEVRYPHLVEYGTAKAPAQPFFWPAYRLAAKRIKARINRSVGKAVRDAAKGGST